MPISLEDIALSYNFTSIKKAVINSTFTYFLQKFIANGEKFGLIGGLSGMNPRLFCNPLSCIIYALSADPFFPRYIHTALLVYMCYKGGKNPPLRLRFNKKGWRAFSPSILCLRKKCSTMEHFSFSTQYYTKSTYEALFNAYIAIKRAYTSNVGSF